MRRPKERQLTHYPGVSFTPTRGVSFTPALTAGFSGVIAALRAGRGTWSEVDSVNLQVLLGASGFAILFSLLPFVALEFLPGNLAWHVLSVVYACVFIGISGFRLREFRRGKLSKRTASRLLPETLSIALVLISNGLLLGASWPYVAVVIWQLARAFLSFAQLLRPGSNRGAA
jgi:hypothetical protein